MGAVRARASRRVIARRWRAAASVARTVLTTVALLVLYYHAPLDRPADVRVVAWLAGGLVCLGAAVAWQARAIVGSGLEFYRAIGFQPLFACYPWHKQWGSRPMSEQEACDGASAL